MAEPVSVIIPTYNRREMLARAIDSVLSQEYPSFELLVIDDGSSDGTTELLDTYGDRIVRIHQKNLGASAARNAGIRAAGCDLLAFLDSDDEFAPGKLARQSEAMAKEPGYLISHTDETWYRNGKHLNQKDRHARSGGDLFARSLEMCVVGMSTVMARRQFFAEVGPFDEELPCCEDYDLWLRAAAKLHFLHIEASLTIKHGGRPDQLSRIHAVGIDRYRIRAIMKILENGTLNPEHDRLARQELVRKCTIYGRGCCKHNREEEGREYLALAARYGS